MANQSIGTPRFYLDFTQLASVKGYRGGFVDDIYSYALTLDNQPRNLNVWNFDYANPTTYTARTSSYSGFGFKCPPFWGINGENADRDWARLMSTTNFAGIINHNLKSSVAEQSGASTKTFNMNPYWYYQPSSGDVFTEYQDSSFFDGINAESRQIDYDGYSIVHFNPSDMTELMSDFNNYKKLTQFSMNISTIDGSYGFGDTLFDIGAITFGKYIDMPNSPDLNVKKTVEYDGVKIKRSLGGSDYVQVDHQGCPDWVSGDPWDLREWQQHSNKKRGQKIGKNGRRSWDLNFSYISNDNLFYDLKQSPVGTKLVNDTYVEETNEIQLIWDLTLGGALSFIFTPDKDKTDSNGSLSPEFAVCRLDQDSLVATQVAYQTWNISMRVVEVW